ncbi:nuclear transport factor 2 family protein [Glacieibacterium frigidum]|uniref:Nuclear transport factor 2 family protein n=1 Tax=Glacieibacterium frigidum TaxID=2593303 RepID=A0A552U916_9SPHN|nr:nuclear transport factor 2 family protein [Glacieibacterium frigidum]TRW14717.1 nuclear transport factor 2 family protein [Glacieibacterium frigidum]
MFRTLAATLLLAAATPAYAAWTTTSDAVREAAKQPDIAGVLDAMTRIDTATMTGDRAAFLGALAPEILINSPQNGVNDLASVTQRFAGGTIAYDSFDRIVDRIAPRGPGEVVVMGTEILRPKGQAMHAGKTVYRRFTDIWRKDGATWKLSLRQATVFKVE